MISLNIKCSNCETIKDNTLEIKLEEGFIVIECASCGDIIKFKSVKKKEAKE